MNMLCADEVKAVVVVIDAVVDAYSIELYILTLNDADGMEGALIQKYVAHGQVLATMKEQMIRTLRAAASGGRGNAALRTAELRALAVDGARSFDGDVLGIDREDQSDIAVAERRVPSERNRIGRVILLAIGGAQQLSLCCDVQRDIALHLDDANNEHTGRHEHCAALILVARIDRRLDRHRVERCAVALRAEITNVVDARTQIVASACGCA